MWPDEFFIVCTMQWRWKPGDGCEAGGRQMTAYHNRRQKPVTLASCHDGSLLITTARLDGNSDGRRWSALVAVVVTASASQRDAAVCVLCVAYSVEKYQEQFSFLRDSRFLQDLENDSVDSDLIEEELRALRESAIRFRLFSLPLSSLLYSSTSFLCLHCLHNVTMHF